MENPRPTIEIDADEYMLLTGALDYLKKWSKAHVGKERTKEIKKLSKKLDKYARESADWVHDNIEYCKAVIVNEEWVGKVKERADKYRYSALGGLDIRNVVFIRCAIGDSNIDSEELDYAGSDSHNGIPYYFFRLNNGHIISYREDLWPEPLIEISWHEWNSVDEYTSCGDDEAFGGEADLPKYDERRITMRVIMDDLDDFKGYIRNDVLLR